MNTDIIIVLPKVISILRDGTCTQLKKNVQEFNIYFKNIILPYKEEYDIQVKCPYGKNYGAFWRLSEYPHDVDFFDLELVIYNEYGKRLVAKKTVIELYDRKEDDAPFNMLFVGDSMTYEQKYIEQIASNLHNIVFKGSRNFFGHISHEGRGGWSYKEYFSVYKDSFGVSPFLFPEGVENYRGDIDFINHVNTNPHLDYSFAGYEKQLFAEGGIYGKEGNLFVYTNGKFILYAENSKWKFDFRKYVKRYNIEKLNAVSLLMGANDLQTVSYEESDEKITEYLNYTEMFINAIHEYDKNIDIIVNLPIIGAEQYAWGTKRNCNGSSKMYRFNIIRAGKAILDKWENSAGNHVYVSPMLLCIDPENGFPKEGKKANKYSEVLETHHSDWVHPNVSGYCQMGDAMCGLIQKLRSGFRA